MVMVEVKSAKRALAKKGIYKNKRAREDERETEKERKR